MDAERMGIVAEAARRCGGLARSELDCGWEVGDPNLPEISNSRRRSRHCRRRRR